MSQQSQEDVKLEIPQMENNTLSSEEILKKFQDLELKIKELENKRPCECDEQEIKQENKTEQEVEEKDEEAEEPEVPAAEPPETTPEEKENISNEIEENFEQEKESDVNCNCCKCPEEPSEDENDTKIMSEQSQENAPLEIPPNMSPEERIEFLEQRVKQLEQRCKCNEQQKPKDPTPEPAEIISEENELDVNCNCEDCKCAEEPSEDESDTKEPENIEEKEPELKEPSAPENDDAYLLGDYYPLQGEDESEEDKMDDKQKIDEEEMEGEDGGLFERPPRFTPERGIWALEQITILLGHHSVEDIIKALKENANMRGRLERLEDSSQSTTDPTNIIPIIEELQDEVAALTLKAGEVKKLKNNLADKADLSELTAKVDRPEFTSAVENLTKDIEEMIGYLTAQVEKWERREAEMKQSLEQLLESHVMNIKEFLQFKLYRYNMKLNKLAKMMAEQSSLGAIGRPQLIRGQSCVACGAGIVMRCEGGVRAPIRALPPRGLRLNPKGPYIKGNRHGGAGEPSSQQYVHQQPSKESGEFFESLTARVGGEGVRHCGGPHTITAAPQRIVRKGNFHQDFQATNRVPSSGVVFAKSPENSPKSEGQ